MIRKILISWIKTFVWVVAVTSIVARYDKRFEIQHISTYIVMTLLVAITVELINRKQEKKSNKNIEL